MLAIVGVVLSLLVSLFALPVWAFIDATRHRGLERYAWFVVIVLLWPIGSLVYGVARPRSRVLRAAAAAIALVNLGLIWVGHRNAVADVGGSPPTLELYEGVRETSSLELEAVLGSYGSPGNDDYVQSLSLSHDGKRLLVSGGRTLRLWDMGRSRVLRTYETLPANDILAGWLHGRWLGRGDLVALSPDGSIVAASRGSVTLRLGFPLVDLVRSLVTGNRHVIDVWSDGGAHALRAHRSNVTSMSFVRDRLVTASYDGTIAVWQLDSGRREQEIDMGQGWIGAAAVSPDGRRAIVSARDPYGSQPVSGHLGIWDMATGTKRLDLSGHEDRAHAVAFASDGQRALSASFDGFRVWDAGTGDELRFVPGNDAVYGVAFSPDGRYALAGATTVYLWDLERGAILDRIPLAACDDQASVSLFAHDASFVVIGTTRGAILRFRWKDGGAQSPEARESEPE